MNIGLVRRGWLSIMGNYFQYVSLVSLSSKGALHCDKIHETHPQPMTEPPPNGTVSWMFLGCSWEHTLYLSASKHVHVHLSYEEEACFRQTNGVFSKT